MNIFEMNSIIHRSSEQIKPKHNRYIEQCHIGEKIGNTKKTYLRRHSSHTSLAPENPKKSTYMHVIGGTRHWDQMKRRENENNIQWKNTIQRKSNKWQIKSHI